MDVRYISIYFSIGRISKTGPCEQLIVISFLLRCVSGGGWGWSCDGGYSGLGDIQLNPRSIGIVGVKEYIKSVIGH